MTDIDHGNFALILVLVVGLPAKLHSNRIDLSMHLNLHYKTLLTPSNIKLPCSIVNTRCHLDIL